MSDIGVAEIPVDEDEQLLPPIAEPMRNALVDGPILRTLLWLAWPNVVALSAGTCVVITETSYIGRLGVESLAAMALVFPFVILTMTMSGGAMGGGVSSAIARALGAGDHERASALAAHALLIGACFGLTFTLVMLLFGPALLELLGGRGNVLARAIGYIQIFFGGAVVPWLMSTLAAILRGTGNMKQPSLIVLNSAVCQIILGGILGLGLGPVPQFGMRGVAAGTLTAFSIGAAIMAWYIFSGRARVAPMIKGLRIQRGMFFDILKVGAVSCFSPLQSVLTITIFTHMLAQFGTEILAGYGVGARLEFMLTSIAFAVGIASVPMVGMAIGARRVARARRPLGRYLHQGSGRARRQPAISVDRSANVRLHRAVDLDVFFLPGCCESFGTGARAIRAAGVRGGRRLVAVDAWRDRCELFRAGGSLDGGARRALRRERYLEQVGTEGRRCRGSSPCIVGNRRLAPIPHNRASDLIRERIPVLRIYAALRPNAFCIASAA